MNVSQREGLGADGIMANDRALEDADLMAQGEDLQLKCGTSPKRGAEEGEKRG